jgi:hypothetical protein
VFWLAQDVKEEKRKRKDKKRVAEAAAIPAIDDFELDEMSSAADLIRSIPLPHEGHLFIYISRA